MCSTGCKNLSKAGVPLIKNSPRLKRPTAGQIKKDRTPSEAQTSKAIGQNLDLHSVWNARLQSGALELKSGHYMKFCPEGTPDRIAAPGVIVFFEVKKEGRTPTPEQLETHSRLRKNGALVFTVDSIDDYLFILKTFRQFQPIIDKVSCLVQGLQEIIDAAIVEHKKGL